MSQSASGSFSAAYKTKEIVSKTTLITLGVAFEIAAKYAQDVKEEISSWREGMVFTMGVLPNGPYMSVKKEGDRIRYLGTKKPEEMDLAILFKNFDAALLVFLGQIGTPTAAAQRRFIVQGNLSESSGVARALDMVQTYLFPGIILKKTFRRPPKLTPAQMLTKAKVYGLLAPVIVKNITK